MATWSNVDDADCHIWQETKHQWLTVKVLQYHAVHGLYAASRQCAGVRSQALWSLACKTPSCQYFTHLYNST